VKPSLVHRLRIGFVITFALLAAITFLAVGHLFQLRQNYEDDTTRSFKVELASEHMRQAFLVEQATVASSAVDRQRASEKFKIDVSNFGQAADDTRGLIEDDPRADQLLDASVAAEKEWRQGAAQPILAGRPLPQSQQSSLAQSVQSDVDRLINSQDTKQSELRDKTAS
jgi:hypothetical protein